MRFRREAREAIRCLRAARAAVSIADPGFERGYRQGLDLGISTIERIFRSTEQSQPGKAGPMFAIGEKIFVRTVTYHAVGKVAGYRHPVLIGETPASPTFLELEDASWVADSGRFHVALETGDLAEVERVGDMAVNLSAVVDAFPWRHELPTKSR